MSNSMKPIGMFGNGNDPRPFYKVFKGPEGFRQVLEILDSKAEFKAFHGLAEFINEDLMCWPSLSTLARVSGTTKRTIVNGIAILESKGLLSRVKEYHNGSVKRTVYTLFPDDGVGKTLPQGCRKDNNTYGKDDNTEGKTFQQGYGKDNNTGVEEFSIEVGLERPLNKKYIEEEEIEVDAFEGESLREMALRQVSEVYSDLDFEGLSRNILIRSHPHLAEVELPINPIEQSLESADEVLDRKMLHLILLNDAYRVICQELKRTRHSITRQVMNRVCEVLTNLIDTTNLQNVDLGPDVPGVEYYHFADVLFDFTEWILDNKANKTMTWGLMALLAEEYKAHVMG